MSFLANVGNVFKKILGIATTAAVIARPFVITAFPELAAIYTSAIGLAVGAEAINPGSGTGPQKLSTVVAALMPQITAWASSNGIVWAQEDIKKWTSTLVDTLNMIPAPTLPVATTGQVNPPKPAA
jgi:hypothetical protein